MIYMPRVLVVDDDESFRSLVTDRLTLLRRIRAARTEVAVSMLPGHGTIDNAVEAMKAGAFNYLQKPCSLAEVEVKIGQATERRRLESENVQLKAALQRESHYQG